MRESLGVRPVGDVERQGQAGEEPRWEVHPAWQPLLTPWGSHSGAEKARSCSPWSLDESLYVGHPWKGMTLSEGVLCGRGRSNPKRPTRHTPQGLLSDFLNVIWLVSGQESRFSVSFLGDAASRLL